MSSRTFWNPSHRPRTERAKTWSAAAARSGLVGSAVLPGGTNAAADVLRYVDRQGKVHEVTVTPEAPAPETPTAATTPTVTLPAPPPAPSPADTPTDELPYAPYVHEAAKLYTLPVELILAVIKIESGFNPHAVSRKGAIGLMQLMPKTAEEVGARDPFDPRQNVLGGARYLRILINAYDGSLTLALAAYHAGAGAVDRYAGVPPYPETQRYVTNVRTLYHAYKDRGAAR